jgi:hypothetical protein
VSLEYFPWNDYLEAEVCGLAYDFGGAQGELLVYPGTQPDHFAVIDLFTAIDPDVKQIVYRPADTLAIEYTFQYRNREWLVRDGDWT